MTSADVAYTFRRFLDPAFVSGRKGAYRDLAAVDIVDRYTVAFRLKAPSASFPINLVTWASCRPAPARKPARRPIGSGPYRLAEFVPDDHVTLAAVRGYYQGAPKNAGLVFKVVPDETMRGLELRKGDVDLVVNDLAPDLVHGLAGGSGACRSSPAPGTDYAYIGLNLRDPMLAGSAGAAGDRLRDRSRGDRPLPAPRPGAAATSIMPSMSWAYGRRPAALHARSRLARRPCSTRPGFAIRTEPVRRRAFA